MLTRFGHARKFVRGTQKLNSQETLRSIPCVCAARNNVAVAMDGKHRIQCCCHVSSFWNLTVQIRSVSAENKTANVFTVEMLVIISALCLAIIIFDLVGNATIIHIVRTRPHMRNNVNILIANLAAADLLMIVVACYLWSFVYQQGSRWFTGPLAGVLCSTLESLQVVSVFVSVYTFLFIAVDRFFAVVLPMKKLFSSTEVKVAVVLIWVTSVAFATPQYLAASVQERGAHFYCRSNNWKRAGISKNDYAVAFVTLTYIIPLVATATLYTTTSMKLWRSKVPGHQIEAAQSAIRKTRRGAVKMLIAVVVVFALCWLPLQVAEFRRALKPYSKFRMPLWLQLLAPWFGVANSAINPYIYVIFCEKFRREFKIIFCSWRRGAPTLHETSLSAIRGRGGSAAWRVSRALRKTWPSVVENSRMTQHCIEDGRGRGGGGESENVNPLLPTVNLQHQQDWYPLQTHSKGKLCDICDT